MNLSSERISNKDAFNSVYLTKLQREPKKKRRVSKISPFKSRRISEPILSMEDFERRFQFNNLVRAYNQLLVKKKANFGSVDEKDSSNRLFLPMIKEIKIKKHGMDDISNEIAYNESEYDTDNRKEGTKIKKNYNNAENNIIDSSNTLELKNINTKSNLNKSDSSLTQSLIENKSTLKSKLSLDYDRERKRLLLRNLSNDSLFAQYKVRYMIALKDFKDRTKIAKENYKDELTKIRNEILPKSKNEELFKPYEFDFNSNKMQIKLKNEFNFFQYKKPKKVVNAIDKRLLLMLKKLKMNKEKKNIWGVVKLKSDSLKPSQRSIQNMLRKQKKIEFDEIKFDSTEKN